MSGEDRKGFHTVLKELLQNSGRPPKTDGGEAEFGDDEPHFGVGPDFLSGAGRCKLSEPGSIIRISIDRVLRET